MSHTLRPCALLAGRDSEVRRVLAALGEPPAAVLVTGDPGIGKSRLLNEVVERLRHGSQTVLLGRCLPDHAGVDFGPIIEALAGLAGRPLQRPPGAVAGALHSLLPELGELLPCPVPPLADPAAQRHRTERGIRELLAAAAPVVLAVENLHWCDPATTGLLSSLLANPAECVSVLATTRPDAAAGVSSPFGSPTLPASSLQVVRLDLGPLGLDGATAVVRGMLGEDPVARSAADAIHQRAGGSPFAVEAFTRMFHARGQLASRGGRWRLVRADLDVVPPEVRQAIAEHLGTLPSSVQRLVRGASVLRIAASEAELQVVSGLSATDVTIALRGGIQAGIITEAEAATYEFRQVLTRDAVYASLPAPDRVRLHVTAGRLLETRAAPPRALIAEHYRRAGHFDQARTATIRAATAALEAGHVDTVLDLALPALREAHVPPDDAVELATLCGRAALYQVDAEPALSLLRTTIARTDLSEEGRGRLWVVLGWLTFNLGHEEREAAIGCFTEAARLLRSSPDQRASALATLALFAADRSPSERLQLLADAADEARRSGQPALQLSVAADRLLLNVREASGAMWDDLAALDAVRAATPEELRQMGRALLNGAHAMLQLGHVDAAARLGGKAATVVTRLPGPWLGNPLKTLRLLIRWTSGPWGGLAQDARRLRTDNGDNSDPCLVEADLVGALLDVATGRADAALATLRIVGDEAADAQEWGAYFLAASGLVRALADGDRAEMADVVQTTAAAAGAHDRWHFTAEMLATLADVAIDADDTALLESWLADARAAMAGRDAPALAAAAVHADAALAMLRGDAATAAAGFAAAVDAWAAIGRPYWQAVAEAARGRCLICTGSPEAHAVLTSALDRFTRLGATHAANRVRQVIRECGLPLPYRRQGYGQQLSPREREVASLLLDGRTDREIAAALFISPRTASKHVAKILQKAGVSRRSALTPDLMGFVPVA